MKIAFVRGPFLNPWELQTYLPLARRHQMTVIGADWQFYQPPMNEMPGPLETPHLWASGAARLYHALPVVLNRLRSWTLGESYALLDLEKAVGNPDVIHTAETYTSMTYQCLEIRRRRRCKVVATIWENLPHMGENASAPQGAQTAGAPRTGWFSRRYRDLAPDAPGRRRSGGSNRSDPHGRQP